jgi:acetylornithine deacetylase/succinyl-diaminopimelate desuccinylase-like protein
LIVLGACGPGSNAHGPNENLDIPFVKKLICVIASFVTKSSELLNK